MDSKKLLDKILAWCKAHNITIEIVSEKELHDFQAVNDAAAKPLGVDMGNANIKISRERNGIPVSDEYFLKTLWHELVERKLMKEDDMKYWSAHVKALEAEEDVKKGGQTDGQSDLIRIEPDDEDKTEVLKAEDTFENVVEFEGQKYVNLGNTFTTDVDVKLGDIIEVNAQGLSITNGNLSWLKPSVHGIDLLESVPYTASMALNIAKKYEGMFRKSEKRTTTQEDLEEHDEGSRTMFEIKPLQEGTLTIDEHITFLDEDSAKEFTNIKTYEAWKSAKRRLERHSGSIHNDIRIKLDDNDFLQGFTSTIGTPHDRNKIIDNQEGDRSLVASFKAHSPSGKIKWQTVVGVDKVWIFEPGEIGSPGKKWSAIFKIEKRARVKFGRVEEHFIELRVTDTKHMLGGRWVLMFAPLTPGHRTWLFSRPKRQEFDEKSLNEIPKAIKRNSLLKAVLENLKV